MTLTKDTLTTKLTKSRSVESVTEYRSSVGCIVELDETLDTQFDNWLVSQVSFDDYGNVIVRFHTPDRIHGMFDLISLNTSDIKTPHVHHNLYKMNAIETVSKVPTGDPEIHAQLRHGHDFEQYDLYRCVYQFDWTVTSVSASGKLVCRPRDQSFSEIL